MEKAADKHLREIAEKLVNPNAETSEEGDEEEDDERELAGAGASARGRSGAGRER